MEEIVGQIIISNEENNFLRENITHLKSLRELFLKNVNKDITYLIKVLMMGTVLLKGSDIHTEPTQEKTVIRARIDGMLTNIAEIENDKYKKILSRIKLLSKLKLNIEKTSRWKIFN